MVQVSRRTVARGAAWAAPVVAMSAAAPAYAAVSYTAPVASVGPGGKCPGTGSGPGGNVWFYNLALTLTSPGGTGYTFRVNSILVDATTHTPSAPVTSPLPSAGGTLLVRFFNDKSDSTYDVSVNYTILHGADEMGTYTSPVTKVKFGVWKTGDFGYCPA